MYILMIDDGGFDNHFASGKWKLNKGNKGKVIVAIGEKIYKLYWTKDLVAKEIMNYKDMEAS